MSRAGAMIAACLASAALAGCDPMWGVSVDVRDPSDRAIAGATVALGCASSEDHLSHFVARTDASGDALVGSIGSQFPPGCDIYIAKRGFHTHRVRYRDMCPDGPSRCERVFRFDLVLQPYLAQDARRSTNGRQRQHQIRRGDAGHEHRAEDDEPDTASIPGGDATDESGARNSDE